MSTLRRLIVAVAPALAVSLGCAERAKVTLRYHPPAGATYRYTMEQHTDMKFEGGPMSQLPEQQMAMHLYFTQTVTGPTAGGIAVTVRLDSTTLDSPLMAANAYRPAFDRIRGLTSNVVYDDRMNVVRSEFAKTGAATISPITEQIAKNLKEATFPLPDGPVGVGDSWTAQMDLPISHIARGGAPMHATTKLTVKEIHAEGADTTILVSLLTTFPEDPIKVQQQGEELTLQISGSLTGDQLFSMGRGAVVRAARSGTMRIHMTGAILGANGTDMTAKQATSLVLNEAK